jgi:hypothetical protein
MLFVILFSFSYHWSVLTDVGLQISWSGCKDSQTSADTEEAGRATGAMSFVSSPSLLVLRIHAGSDV